MEMHKYIANISLLVWYRLTCTLYIYTQTQTCTHIQIHNIVNIVFISSCFELQNFWRFWKTIFRVGSLQHTIHLNKVFRIFSFFNFQNNYFVPRPTSCIFETVIYIVKVTETFSGHCHIISICCSSSDQIANA